MGKYNLLSQGFVDAAVMYVHPGYLENSTVEELMQIRGVGLKTAKFFIMFSRDNEKHAILDTHILKWLRNLGYDEDPDTPVPLITPSSPTLYAIFESLFISEVEDRLGLPPKTITARELVQADFAIWKHYANGDKLPEYLC